jgi:hypothetical protein
MEGKIATPPTYDSMMAMQHQSKSPPNAKDLSLAYSCRLTRCNACQCKLANVRIQSRRRVQYVEPKKGLVYTWRIGKHHPPIKCKCSPVQGPWWELRRSRHIWCNVIIKPLDKIDRIRSSGQGRQLQPSTSRYIL